jgi:hypothetical protein
MGGLGDIAIYQKDGESLSDPEWHRVNDELQRLLGSLHDSLKAARERQREMRS